MPGKGWLEVQLLAVGSASLAVQLENDNSKEALGRYIREHYLTHLDTAMRQMAQLEKQNRYDWKLRHPTIPFGDAQKRVDNVADLTIWKLSQKLHAAGRKFTAHYVSHMGTGWDLTAPSGTQRDDAIKYVLDHSWEAIQKDKEVKRAVRQAKKARCEEGIRAALHD